MGHSRNGQSVKQWSWPSTGSKLWRLYFAEGVGSLVEQYRHLIHTHWRKMNLPSNIQKSPLATSFLPIPMIPIEPQGSWRKQGGSSIRTVFGPRMARS